MRHPMFPRHLTFLLVLAACGGNGKKEQRTKEPEAPTQTAPAPLPAPEPAEPKVTPAELYEQCKDRMENPQADGACKVDADCASAGCGQEVCTTVAQSKTWNTTCEDKACFKVADSCGCHDGKCTWTLKAEVPAGSGKQNKLPPSLPPTPAPGN